MTQVRFGAGAVKSRFEQIPGPVAVLGRDRGADALVAANPLSIPALSSPDRPHQATPSGGMVRRSSAVIFRRP